MRISKKKKEKEASMGRNVRREKSEAERDRIASRTRLDEILIQGN